MTLTRYNVETGNNGDAASGTHTGAAFHITTGGAFTVSTDWARVGTRSVKAVANSTSGGAYMNFSVTATNTLWGAIPCYFSGTPSGTLMFLRINNGSNQCASIDINSTRNPLVKNASGGLLDTLSAIPLNTPVAIYWAILRNSSTGTLRVGWSSTALDLPTSLNDETGMLTGLNTGPGAIDSYRLGSKATTSTNTWDALYLDNYGHESGFSDFQFPPPDTQLVAGNIYKLLDARTSTPGSGGSLSYSITPNSGVIAVGDGRFFVPNPNSNTNYHVTATETPGGLTGDSSDVTVAPFGVGLSGALVWNGTAWV